MFSANPTVPQGRPSRGLRLRLYILASLSEDVCVRIHALKGVVIPSLVIVS